MCFRVCMYVLEVYMYMMCINMKNSENIWDSIWQQIGGEIGVNSRSHRYTRHVLLSLPGEHKAFEGEEKTCQSNKGEVLSV